MSGNLNSVPLDDPTALERFGHLDFVARLVVEGYMIGQHQSPFKGSSVEFVEHRQYYPGDEIRHIDWRAFGKTGKYYIKEFEEETNLRAYLLVDSSGSMGYGESTLSKFRYARALAASLGYLLVSQRDAVGLITFDTEIRERIEPSTNQMTFQRIAQVLETTQTGGETRLSDVFQKIASSIKRRSLIIIVSDFFDDIEPLAQALKQFRHANHEVVMIQVVAPEEEEFPFNRPTLFRSLELQSHRILVDPHRLRSMYLQQYQEFLKELQQLCGNTRIDYLKLQTSQPFHKALGAYLATRKQGIR